MKNKIIISILLMSILQNLYAGMFGSVDISGISSNNVYEDSSCLSDTGISINGDINYRGKITKTTYPRMGYSFSSISFPDIKLENEYDHFLSGALKQRLGHYVDLDLMAGYDSYQFPNAKTYSSSVVYGKPAVYIYPFAYTEIDAGYIFENVSYPKYDLDNAARGYFTAVYQDLPFELSAVLKGTTLTREYSDRAVYDLPSIASPLASNTLREDTEYDYSIVLKRYFIPLGWFELEYRGAGLDSNANEFYWGSNQSSDQNTIIGDESILPDYWDYTEHQYSVRYRSDIIKKISFETYGLYQNRIYDGWIARTADGTLHPDNELRNDTLYLIYIEGKRELFKNLFLIVRYTNKNNQSNDYYYDAQTSLFSLGFKYFF